MAKNPNPFKVFLVDQIQISPNKPSDLGIDTITAAILFSTSATATVLPLIPYDNIDGNRIPTVIFKGSPSLFHGFIISIMFAFSLAFSALFSRKKLRISRVFQYFSMVSIVSAIGFLIFAFIASCGSS